MTTILRILNRDPIKFILEAVGFAAFLACLYVSTSILGLLAQ